jgi:transposase
MGITVYVIHNQARPKGMLKSDKRDALGLANTLYNQLEKGVQFADKTQLVRRLFPPTEASLKLKGLSQHRYELLHETTRRKNKLTSICDELFPELTKVLHNPNCKIALAIRKRFPTPEALAQANFRSVCKLRKGSNPTKQKLEHLQTLARESIGTKDGIRQHALVFEQTQLIAELQMLQEHVDEIDREISTIVAYSREGQILTSMPAIGTLQAGLLLAAIGNIVNFQSAAMLKAYCGWAPKVDQSGKTLNQVRLTKAGNHPVKHTLFLIVCNAIRMDCEWIILYDRLVPRKCRYDEQTRKYRGKLKVVGRIAGQMLEMIYAFLKYDQEILRKIPPGEKPPDPMLYDPAKHRAHKTGHYLALKPTQRQSRISLLPQYQYLEESTPPRS